MSQLAQLCMSCVVLGMWIGAAWDDLRESKWPWFWFEVCVCMVMAVCVLIVFSRVSPLHPS